MPNCVDQEARADPTSAAGFTLLEVIIALAISALALVGLFHVGSTGLLSAENASRVEEAIERAQSHLSAFGRAGAIVPGGSSGNDGDGYRWELQAIPIAQITKTTSQSEQTAVSLALYDVAVRISWRDGRRTSSVTLETRRLGAASGGG